MSDEPLPPGWAQIEIEDCLLPYPNGKRIRQGWSPQCEDHPAQSHDEWAVLRTSAIQDGSFVEAENKKLPKGLEPRPHLEVQAGDILITCAGPRSRCGVTCLVRATRARLLISGKMYQLRSDPEVIEQHFLELFLRESGTRKKIDGMKTGISDSGLNLTHDRFRTLTIPLPPLAEQKRIVAKIEVLFSELEAGEESLRLARRQLSVYRQALLKHAFEGKLTTCRKIELIPLRELITGLSQGWSPKCELNRTPKIDEWAIIKTTAIQHCRYDDSEAKPLPPPFEPRPSIEIKDGDFLMTRKGPRARAGVSCYVRKTRPLLMVCDTVYRFRCIEEKVHPLYLELALNSPDVLGAIDREKAGISESGLSLTHTKIRTVEVPLCSLPEQQEIVRVLNAQFEVIERNEREIDAALQRSEALRQAILKKAFTGGLVPQLATDEPASQLLARLRGERDASGSNPRRKKTAQPVPPVSASTPASSQQDLFPEIKAFKPLGKTDLQAGIVALAFDRFARRGHFFGHTIAEKVVHLADALAELELERHPVKDAAGPNDFKRAKKIEHRAKIQGWFSVTKAGRIYDYQAGRNFSDLLQATEQTLGAKFTIIENLLEQLLELKDTRAIEVFATVYAAWNNLMLQQKPVSDDAIVSEARENWHVRKLEIPRDRFFKAIAWMKKKRFIPKGIGQVVTHPGT